MTLKTRVIRITDRDGQMRLISEAIGNPCTSTLQTVMDKYN